MSEPYRRYRTFYQDISGQLKVLATTDDTTLVTVRNANHTIYIQKIHFFVSTDAAQSINFEDSASPTVIIFGIPASPGVNSTWVMDFGPMGYGLTEGKNFLMDVSAIGVAGKLTWEGYQKLTAVGAA